MHAPNSLAATRPARVFATPYAYTADGLPLFLEAVPSSCYPSPTSSMGPVTVSSPVRLAAAKPLVAKRRKKRLVWTAELHASFEVAVTALGVDTAGPKQIMAAMGVPELTRENVSSHLQKYRDGIRRTRERERMVAVESTISPKPFPPLTPSPRDVSQGFAFPPPTVRRVLPASSPSQVKLPPIRLSPPLGEFSKHGAAPLRRPGRSW